MKRMKGTHGAAIKAKEAFAALKGDKTPAELAAQCGGHPVQITK
jgi:hypothetical protein